jgi:hypothetical protein
MTSPIDMTTVAAVDAYLNIPVGNTPANTLIGTLITAASQFIISYCNRNFLSQSYLENRDSSGQSEWLTLGYPIQSVQQVLMNGQVIPPSGGWTANGPAPSGYNFGQWSIYIDGYLVPRGRKNIQLSYTAGFEAYPADLAQACLEVVALKYKQKDRIGVSGSESIDGQTITYRDIAMSQSALAVISTYRRVTPIPQ